MNVSEILNAVEKQEIKIFSGRGRGRKQCPECKVYIGVRHKVCVCKHKFVKKPEPVPEIDSPEYVEAREFITALGYNHVGFRILFIPRGKCPVKFKGNVVEWADAVVERYYGDNFILAPSALYYMLGHFTPMNSKSYFKNKKQLTKWIAEVKGT